ncbi:hypothetical protein DYB31_011393 [Aphanomyces astaci]|uniref:Uncharacterized protein n=1 Tax=Aphanomyces astaci TaxID=112090 RepID=A0A397FL36_APHAT|nr:hypothetical protein DYB31_011393 [Aphanomyces astaci]
MGSTALRNESSGKTSTSTRLEPEEVAVVAAIFQLCGCSQIRLMIFYERGQAATASPLEVAHEAYRKLTILIRTCTEVDMVEYAVAPL